MTDLAPLASFKLAALPGIKHAFFTRKGGVSTGLYDSLNVGRGSKDDAADVIENRRRAAAWFGAEPGALLTCYQIHSAKVLVADQPWGDSRPEADGVATVCSGLVCGALSADCAPVLLADPQARVVGACHAGWKGALGGVIEAAVGTMVSEGASANRIVAAVGPCIGPESYEVGLEFLAAFEAGDPGAARFFRPGGAADKRLFDLPAYALHRLARAGVADAEWTGHDTCADEALFFSNRRAVKRGEGDYGRLLSAIALM
jgi:YfiH family protein